MCPPLDFTPEQVDAVVESKRLSLVSDQACALQLKEGRFCLSRAVIEQGGTEAARLAFEAYFSDKGTQRFIERVAYFTPKAVVDVAVIKMKEMGYRWASCGKNGQLNFHWKYMMPPAHHRLYRGA